MSGTTFNARFGPRDKCKTIEPVDGYASPQQVTVNAVTFDDQGKVLYDITFADGHRTDRVDSIALASLENPRKMSEQVIKAKLEARDEQRRRQQSGGKIPNTPAGQMENKGPKP